MIFLGSGCASLSILVRLIDSGKFADKKILLIDKDAKNKNDRTWCFWEKEAGYFEPIIYKSWNNLHFLSDHSKLSLDIYPYKYKMIRGIDFYEYCFSKINAQSNITIAYGAVSFLNGDDNMPALDGKLMDVKNAIVFNSLYFPSTIPGKDYVLKQHFKGWTIETEKPIFDPESATMMDFRIDQLAGTSFVYVLPLSATRALVEYTQFNNHPLLSMEYDQRLEQYIGQFLPSTAYAILEQEMGAIPMTTESFTTFKNGMYNIGTAGGQTKASTGYTFRFIQKQADDITQRLISGGLPSKMNHTPKRFRFYDNTLLHILTEEKLEGKAIFYQLFSKNKASAVFKFLDNESTLVEELSIITSLPTMTFMKAGIKELVKLYRH